MEFLRDVTWFVFLYKYVKNMCLSVARLCEACRAVMAATLTDRLSPFLFLPWLTPIALLRLRRTAAIT